MGIAHYLKEIGRGHAGARALDRAQACDLMGQILDGQVSDLEVGGFCLAMRIKGETPEEMAGFLDAVEARLTRLNSPSEQVTVVLPSYNGARKLPVLTPLLALLLAREGLPVVVHGTPTETSRVLSQEVFQALGISPMRKLACVKAGEVAVIPTELLSPALQKLLNVRRVVGLRNSAHSLVKLMDVVSGPSLRVASYTHPEYAVSMAATFGLLQAHALLLRGTEGEVVADARRQPQMDGFVAGEKISLQTHQAGPLTELPNLPAQVDAASTAGYIRAVLAGDLPVPQPIARQVACIQDLSRRLPLSLSESAA